MPDFERMYYHAAGQMDAAMLELERAHNDKARDILREAMQQCEQMSVHIGAKHEDDELGYCAMLLYLSYQLNNIRRFLHDGNVPAVISYLNLIHTDVRTAIRNGLHTFLDNVTPSG